MMYNELTYRNIIKSAKLLFLCYCWWCWSYSLGLLPTLAWIYLGLEYVDIPYTYFIKKKHQACIGIAIHHSLMLTGYMFLRTTPHFAWPHILTFMVHHTLKNIPYDSIVLKTIFPISWTSQAIAPVVVYLKDTHQVVEHVHLMVNLQVAIFVVAGICLYIGVTFVVRLTGRSLMVSYPMANGEYGMKHIL